VKRSKDGKALVAEALDELRAAAQECLERELALKRAIQRYETVLVKHSALAKQFGGTQQEAL
jgi:hypothetical protein